MKLKLISVTTPAIPSIDNPDDLIAYCARVSNPSNQMNTETAPRLLKYLIAHRHWSPFEMVSMCVEIQTTRAIAAQILRHRSFSFQEFSQRYAAVDGNKLEFPDLRMKAETNRQSSVDPASAELHAMANQYITKSFKAYNTLLDAGVATESARMVLPMCTPTTMYMHGTIRSWIHYLEQRCDAHTQLEHREIAIGIRDSFLKVHFPGVHEAVFGE